MNDDYTPMEFVVIILMAEFRHAEPIAQAITMDIHQKGKGIAGVYTREVAETKMTKVIAVSRKNEFPLEVVIEVE